MVSEPRIYLSPCLASVVLRLHQASVKKARLFYMGFGGHACIVSTLLTEQFL